MKLAVAESCTGGMISDRITNVRGSSGYFLGGIVAYAYEVKASLLNVSWETLKLHGAVSRETVLEMAKNSCIPVINALSDRYHPCQALTDLYTIKEKRGTLKGLKVSFVGDGNNVARSLALLCARLGVAFSIASPNGYGLDKEFLDEINEALGQIFAAPEAFGYIHADVRCHLLHRFPFGILYILEPKDIFIVAVMHLHREPEYWKHRLKN